MLRRMRLSLLLWLSLLRCVLRIVQLLIMYGALRTVYIVPALSLLSVALLRVQALQLALCPAVLRRHPGIRRCLGL